MKKTVITVYMILLAILGWIVLGWTIAADADVIVVDSFPGNDDAKIAAADC